MRTATRSGVALPADHPGFSDPAYRARRDLIAAIGAAYESGQPIPDVPYTAQEDEVWRLVSASWPPSTSGSPAGPTSTGADGVGPAPRRRAAAEPRCPTTCAAITGFRIEPVPGLVPARRFYGALADRRFLSSQYIRHHSVPFYTPEPDVIHEVIGHANGLANPSWPSLYEAAGGASRRAIERRARTSSSAGCSGSRWSSALVWEDGELRTYGAGLLSSYGELDLFRSAEIRPFDIRGHGHPGLRHHPVPAAAVRAPAPSRS